MGMALILLGLLFAYLFLRFWPSELDTNSKGTEVEQITFWGNRIVIHIRLDVQLLVIVMLAGGLGSFIHSATSFGDYVGNETLTQNWIWWYLLRPFIGMALALIFYLVIRGGFLSRLRPRETRGRRPLGVRHRLCAGLET